MKIIFLSRGRRAVEITAALKKKNIFVKTFIIHKPTQFLQAIFYLLIWNYDIIHTDSLLDTAFFASIFGKIRRKKITCLVRGYRAHLKKKDFNILKRIFFNISEKVSLKLIDHIFFISKNTQKIMLQNYNIKQSYSIAQNGINIPENIQKINIRKIIKQKYKKEIKKNDVILITASTLSFKEKAQGIEVLKRTMQFLPDTVWLIALGGGKYLRKLEKRKPTNVVFLGFQKNVTSWLNSSDIFVYCSLLDAFPTVMLEAQAAGLPVVASNTCGLPETTKHGILCNPAPKSFAKALKPLIKLKKLRQKRGKLNKDWIKKRNWDWAIQQYTKKWKKMINK